MALARCVASCCVAIRTSAEGLFPFPLLSLEASDTSRRARNGDAATVKERKIVVTVNKARPFFIMVNNLLVRLKMDLTALLADLPCLENPSCERKIFWVNYELEERGVHYHVPSPSTFLLIVLCNNLQPHVRVVQITRIRRIDK